MTFDNEEVLRRAERMVTYHKTREKAEDVALDRRDAYYIDTDGWRYWNAVLTQIRGTRENSL